MGVSVPSFSLRHSLDIGLSHCATSRLTLTFQTMDDFEYAVESQTLPQFLKQDQDTHVDPSTSADQSGTAAGCGGSGSTTVGQGELERLMREMSEADLDKLAGELGVGLDSGDVKVGLMVPEGAEPADATSPGGNSALDGGAAGPGLASEGVGAEKEEKAGTGGGDLENIGLKGTGEVIRDPDLELKERLERVSLAAAGAGEEAGMPGSSLVGQLEQIAAGVEKSGGKEKVD